jgi:ribosomal protein L11 methyltransferase
VSAAGGGPPPSVIEIALRLDGEAAEAVSALFEEHGGGAVVETLTPPHGPVQHWVRTYIPAGDVDARARIEIGLWHLGQIYPIGQAVVRPLAEANWAEAWKAHFRPLRVGRRLLVCPSWLDPEPDQGDLVIRLDPGMAFGTGLHPTTQLCLQAVESLVRPGDAVLDLGTGSGILGIAAALVGGDPVVAVDMDPEAVRIAAANAERNAVRVVAVCGEIDAAPHLAYRVVLANLLASIVIQLAARLYSRTEPGGTCVTSGVLVEQVEGVSVALQAAGFEPARVATSGDWAALYSRRATGTH